MEIKYHYHYTIGVVGGYCTDQVHTLTEAYQVAIEFKELYPEHKVVIYRCEFITSI